MSDSKKIPSKLTKGLPARKTPKFKGSLTDKGENQMKPVPDEQTQYPMPKWLKADSKKELKEFEEFLEISQLLEMRDLMQIPFKDGGRVGYQEGGDVESMNNDVPMVMTYDQLRAKLPDFITDEKSLIGVTI